MSHDSNYFRRFAENADGMRGKDQYAVVLGGELVLVDVKPPGESVKVRTEFSGPGMRTMPQLSVDGKVTPVDADVLFVGQSAVEKFAVPYYARMLKPDKLKEQVDKLFTAGNTVAFHIPGSSIDAELVERRPGLYVMNEKGELELIVEE